MFIETPRFPEAISARAVFGPAYSTQVVRKFSGREQRNQRWSSGLRKGTVGHDIQDQSEFDVLLDFFNVAEAETHGWRFKDWSDFSVNSGRGRLGDLGVTSAVALGTGKPDYQLFKRYTNSLSPTQNPKDRVTSKPVSGQISVWRTGSLVAFGASSGNISVDTTTGTIKFIPDLTRAINSITKANPGVVTSSGHGFTNSIYIYLRGVAGMTQVQSLVFTIAGVTNSTFNLGVDTSAYSTYTGSGFADRFPQNSEALSWSGQFDTPCRFDTDHMAAVTHLINNESWPTIPIIEIRT